MQNSHFLTAEFCRIWLYISICVCGHGPLPLCVYMCIWLVESMVTYSVYVGLSSRGSDLPDHCHRDSGHSLTGDPQHKCHHPHPPRHRHQRPAIDTQYEHHQMPVPGMQCKWQSVLDLEKLSSISQVYVDTFCRCMTCRRHKMAIAAGKTGFMAKAQCELQFVMSNLTLTATADIGS